MDIKYFWTKTHTLLGITAGTILCVVGVTGAIQSFEEELLRLLNPKVFAPASQPSNDKKPGELFAQAQAARPEQRIVSWQMRSTSGYPVRVGYAGQPQPAPEQLTASQPGTQEKSMAPAKPLPKPRTEFRYLSATSGELHPPLRGEGFFKIANDIHRRLAAGDAGKQIVGASVLGLVVLSLSGLYLRWPHNPLNWRNWFKLDFKLKGRRLLRDLHMVTGTWLLLLYLLSALTGLYWSYDWYKNSLYALTGATPPIREVKLDKPAQGIMDIEQVWPVFLRESGNAFHEATLRFPEKKEHALEIRYLAAEPAHNRAFNRLFLHPDSGAVIAHERHAEKSAGAKLMAGIYPLHTGNFFGLPGILLMMTAALMMPLFGITGWIMYLDRHRREHRAAEAAERFPRASEHAPKK